MRIQRILTICALFLASSCASTTVIPDQTIAHQLAEPTRAVLWLRRGKSEESQAVEFTIPAGWWVLPPTANKPKSDGP